MSIQVLEKRKGRNVLIKSIGSSKDADRIKFLKLQAKRYIESLTGQLSIDLDHKQEHEWFDQVYSSIKNIQLAGPELILGSIFDQIGFDQISSDLFRHLVISRIIYPSSKLKTIRYLREYEGKDYKVEHIYRYLDKLHASQKQQVEHISYNHTLKLLNQKMSVVFYDVTTIYFEASEEDDLRKTGFSKEGKHKHPQILLGLLVSVGGYPLAYEIFEGNKYEGHTMLPVIEKFRDRFELEKLIIIADSGLMTKKNIHDLIDQGQEFILGARIKNESKTIKDKILALQLEDGKHHTIEKDDNIKLVIAYSVKRAAKDAHNRKRGLTRLEKALSTGKLTKNHINNRGYNKYLKLTGKIDISIDYDKYDQDARWDGLKGYLTNTKLSAKDLISNYKELWSIENAFRISKTDLRIRPIYHRIQRRIEAHICISFAAYKVYKELERQLKQKNSPFTTTRTIELMKTIYSITLTHPKTKSTENRLFTKSNDQKILLQLFQISLG